MATRLQIDQAHKLAEKSILEMATGYGCLLIYNGKVISSGHNKRKGNRFDNIHKCLL